MAEQRQTVYFMLENHCVHGCDGHFGATTRKDWADAWVNRQQNLGSSTACYEEYVLDNPEEFPEAREQEGGV